MGKILVIDDDTETTNQVSKWLKLEQHLVDAANTAREAHYYLKSIEYDIVILDWQLRDDLSGIDILRQYRSGGGEALVLMLTGMTAASDVEVGLDAGADDYLRKPFVLDELSAKVRSLMRRSGGKRKDESIVVADLTLNPTAHELKRGNDVIALLPLELQLLKFLMLHPNQIFSPEALKVRVWRDNESNTVDSVRKYIHSLREKLCKEDSSAYIQTVHSVGYKFSPARK